jgi:hypothetical protein
MFESPPSPGGRGRDKPPTTTVGSDPAIVTDKRVLEFYRYWLARRGERRFPGRADIGPTDIPHLLSGMMLPDVQCDPLDFEYRLIGDAVVSRLGSLKGQAGTRGGAILAYRPGRPTLMLRVHCPLSTDGTTIDKIISYCAFLQR